MTLYASLDSTILDLKSAVSFEGQRHLTLNLLNA